MTRKDYFTLLSWAGSQTQGLGTLLQEYGSPRALFTADWPHEADRERLAALPGATQRVLHKARRSWPRPNPRPLFSALSSIDAQHFVPLGDARYPQRLTEIPDPPPWFFYHGDPDCLSRPAVAIVGSRRASHAGLNAAGAIAAALAASGYTVCSGLALGIDAAAHRGALEEGVTAAVLASGLDLASPLRHRALARDIAVTGCVLTEQPPGTPPSKHQFPRRNRIISGVSQATIIVEAAQPSGSLHTAAAALEQGREVYALPWSIFHQQGAGCLRLIRDGATPITAMDELATLFPGVAPVSQDRCALPPGDAATLLEFLGDTSLSFGALQAGTGLGVPCLLRLLSELELSGWLSRADGRYCRADRKSCKTPGSC